MSFHSLLVLSISAEKPKSLMNVLSHYILFPLVALDILSLSLTFDALPVMCFGIRSFAFRNLVVLSAS